MLVLCLRPHKLGQTIPRCAGADTIPPRSEAAAATRSPIRKLLKRAAEAGFASDFVRGVILPDWWSKECDSDASLLPELEIRLSRFLGIALSELRIAEAPLRPRPLAAPKLRRAAGVGSDRLAPAIHAALRVAGAVVRNLSTTTPQVQALPTDASEWRRHLLQQGQPPTLQSVVPELWGRGIPVIHMELLPSPKFQGLAAIVHGRPVVVLGQMQDAPARLAFWMLHEAAHIGYGDCSGDQVVVDESEESSPAHDKLELRADAFAWRVLTGGGDLPPAPSFVPKKLAQFAVDVAASLKADPGIVVWSIAHRAGQYPAGAAALRALFRDTGGQQVLRVALDEYLDLDSATEFDRQLLRCIARDPERAATPH